MKKLYFIGLIPVTLLGLFYSLGFIFEMLSAKSDVQVFLGVLLSGGLLTLCAYIVNYSIQYIINNNQKESHENN